MTTAVNVGLAGIGSDEDSYRKFLTDISIRFPESARYLDHEQIRALDLNVILADLKKIESGGFSHENVGGHYGRQQLNAGRALARSHGYLALARVLQRERRWHEDDVLFDVLAGNGTFDRVMQQLVAERPKYVGNDVSITMVRQAHSDNRLVFYSDLRMPLLLDGFADYSVSAYGTHHVPPDERQAFVTAAARRLKTGGTLVVQDFIEGSPTACWYSECIDQFRTHGHNYQHFARGELGALLRDAGLADVTEHLIYDPFVMSVESGCSDEAARGHFYDYLIELFALDRLQRIVEQERLSIRTLDNLLSPYFTISAQDLDEVGRDPANGVADALMERGLTVKTIDGARCLVAPRVAIAAAGTRPALN
jgi:SAM-dependent methyltransferase